MNKDNYLAYLNSLSFFKKMRNCKAIDETEYLKSEEYLAKKHCINNGNLYRQNDLINKDFRVIYDTAK